MHGLNMGELGCENTDTRRVCILAPTYRIMGREKGQISYGSRAKAGYGGHEVYLPGWPMPPLGN